MSDFASRKLALGSQLAAAGGVVRLAKRTSSNLFRYAPRVDGAQRIDLSGFDHVLQVDRANATLDVEGLATFGRIVERTLPAGLVPLVTPELKHITIGGAIVGIGIESSCFRHGFVHDGLLEAEVLLSDGRVVQCTPDNEHAALFRALPNSYGTLGYVLRAKMRLMPALPYVQLRTERYDRIEPFLDAMREATGKPDVDFIEGLFYSDRRLLLTISRFVANAPRLDDIYRGLPFYKLIEAQPEVTLTTTDYLFRYDPDWFWNIPETGFYRVFRRFAPHRLRNSGFYKRYVERKRWLLDRVRPRREEREEPLIQDWEVPWAQASTLTRYALEQVDLEGRPWIVTPIRTPVSPTIYPVPADTLYYNLGCYCQVSKVAGRGEFYATRVLDEKCFELGGIKMLYSSTFLPQAEFDRIYNGVAYAQVKRQYDPAGRLPTLYQKCATSPA